MKNINKALFTVIMASLIQGISLGQPLVNQSKLFPKGLYTPIKIEWDTLPFSENTPILLHKKFIFFYNIDGINGLIIKSENEKLGDSILLGVQFQEILKCNIKNQRIESKGNLKIDAVISLDSAVTYLHSWEYKVIAPDTIEINKIVYIWNNKFVFNDNGKATFKLLDTFDWKFPVKYAKQSIPHRLKD